MRCARYVGCGGGFGGKTAGGISRTTSNLLVTLSFQCGDVSQGFFDDAYRIEEQCFHDCEAEPDSCDKLLEMTQGCLSDCDDVTLAGLMTQISTLDWYPAAGCGWMGTAPP